MVTMKQKKTFMIAMCLLVIHVLYSCCFLRGAAFDYDSQLGRYSQDVHTNISEYIDINGYYTSTSSYHKNRLGHYGIFFFDDGTLGDFYTPRTLHPYINKYEKWKKSILILDKDSTFGYGGYYTICGDTLVADIYTSGQISCGLGRSYYKIIDRNHLHLYMFQLIYGKGECYYYPRDIIYEFVPMDSLPDPSNVRIKRKKWMWENKNDWKDYKKKMKERRKMYKKQLKKQNLAT